VARLIERHAGAVARTFAREGAEVFLSGCNATPVEAVFG
jgi:hypothetical protein